MTSTAEAEDTDHHAKTDQCVSGSRANRTWVQPLADVIRMSNGAQDSRLRTPLTCHNATAAPVLYLPLETAPMHARSTRYIRTFARENGFKLGNDRRNCAVQPLSEQRDRKPPMIALGLSLLLKQTGLPGAARTLSKPHTLSPESEPIPMGDLIRMAAYATPRSKRVVVLPNRILINTLQDTQPISAHACKLQHGGQSTILSHFDSPYFRAVGYSSKNQYVVHICLAGGPREHSSLWTRIPTLTNTDFNFQLFPGQKPKDDFGLFYITFYLDLAAAPLPWWLQDGISPASGESEDTHESGVIKDQPEEHRKAS